MWFVGIDFLSKVISVHKFFEVRNFFVDWKLPSNLHLSSTHQQHELFTKRVQQLRFHCNESSRVRKMGILWCFKKATNMLVWAQHRKLSPAFSRFPCLVNLTCLYLCSIPNGFPPNIVTFTLFASFAVSIISTQFYYLQCSHPSHVNTNFLLSFVRVISKCSRVYRNRNLEAPKHVFTKIASHNLGVPQRCLDL